ncbi:MAG: hypothetical protein FWG72_02900 [Oscillospiraceae bacterium]|nr:hypothetical protein [Oscillospiraceae bacterium]
MKKHLIDVSALRANGQAEIELRDNAAHVHTTHSITTKYFTLENESHKKHSVSLPDTYRLPFRVDMTVNLDFPSFFLIIGGGHITFAFPPSHNRKIEDIIKPSGKPNQDLRAYDNSLPFGEDADISVTYNTDEMQIVINGEERFYSRKLAYMKIKDPNELRMEELAIMLAVSKRSTLTVKAIAVTEYDAQAPVTRGGGKEYIRPAAKESPKHTFDSILAHMPERFAEKVTEMDRLLKSMRPLKFKRTLDKNGGKISYVASEFGFSYLVHPSGAQSFHEFGWYIVYNGKPETWHCKADFLEETLTEAAKTNPALSERIFDALNDCVNPGSGCLAKRLYAFNGRKRLSCHGRVMLRMCDDDFNDVQAFIRHLNALIEQKISSGEPPPEKINLSDIRHKRAAQ